MQANTIPGTTQTQYGLMIVDIKIFYTHASATVDLAEQRRLWIAKNKRWSARPHVAHGFQIITK